MNVLPLIARELRQQARRPLTRWTRLGVAAFSTLLVLSYVLSWSANPAAPWNMGGWAFHALAWFGLLLAWGAAFLTSDAISRERREGTLGLLFLTDLSGLDVVLAKFAATAYGGVYVCLGLAPALMVSLLPGGVTGGEVARVTLVLVESLLLASALGLFLSTRTGTALHSAPVTLIWLAALIVLPWLMARMPWFPSLISGFELLTPLAIFQLVDDLAYRTAPNRFWLSAGVLLLETAALLVLAGRILTRNWRQEIAETPVKHGSRDKDVRRGVNLLGDAEPIAWLIGRQHRQTALLWTAAVLMFATGQSDLLLTYIYKLAGPLGFTGLPITFFAFYTVFNTVTIAVPLALFALAAGRFNLAGRQTGAFELLLSTPVGAPNFMQGQWKYFRRALLGPSILVMMRFPLLALIILTSPSMNKSHLALWHALLLMPVHDLLTIAAAILLGLVFGARCRSAAALMAWTVGLMIGTQWLWSFAHRLIITLILVPTGTFTGPMPLYQRLFFEMYSVVQIAIVIGLIVWAKYQLARPRTNNDRSPIAWGELFRRVRHWTPAAPN